MKRVLVVGATSRIAEQCARLWNTGEVTFVLVGRSAERLGQIARDLETRNARCAAEVRVADLTDPAAVRSVVDDAVAAGGIDIALLAQGTLPEQEAAGADLAATASALTLNAVSPVLFAQAIADAMLARGTGSLAILGSVAGDRGRKSNYLYGAAKAMLATAAEGLQHRLAGTPIRVVLVKPGPTDTPMTAHLKRTGARLTPAPVVARQIVRAVAKGTPVVYTPPVWRPIMGIIRVLPRRVFHRLEI